MKRQQGPTKRLAPYIGPDTVCPHEFAEDEGVQLEIDCSECSGANDLSNKKCLTSTVNAVSGGAVPDCIILKRFIHKRYRGGAVWIVSKAAWELASLNRALNTTEQPSDKICRTCTASKTSVIAELRRRLLDDPRSYVSGGENVFEEVARSHASCACERARSCIDSGLSASTIHGGDS